MSAAGWGAVGVVLVLLTIHLYVDHMALHQLIDLVNRQAQAQQAK